MSSSDEAHEGHSRQRRSFKKPRVARACEFCRRRKIRCDGGQGEGGKCSTCSSQNKECSFVRESESGPSGYVDALERKLIKMEALLKQLHPDEDFSRDIGIHLTRENWMIDGALGGSDLATEPSPFVSASATSASTSTSDPAKPSTFHHDPSQLLTKNDCLASDDDDEEWVVKLDSVNKDFKSMNVSAFLGKSSSPYFMRAAVNMKYNDKPTARYFPLKEFGHIHRPKYWTLNPWEKKFYEVKLYAYDFPEPSLLYSLIDLYFENINVIHHALHRPSFEKDIRRGLHLHQEPFGALVLLVCALGARFSDDPRVLVDGEDDSPPDALSCGWKYYAQVSVEREFKMSTSRLLDMQICALACLFLHGCSRLSLSFTACSSGLRIAQEIGVHKRKVYSKFPRLEDELFKRTFWVLFCLDRVINQAMGRACTIQEEDIDLDLPVDCDDEYFDSFGYTKQPEGKPSQISYLIYSIKLSQIQGLILRSVYASTRAKALFGYEGPAWAQRTVANFDSLLNQWFDSLPEHLRWDPSRPDERMFNQSAHLITQFYQVQILLHRPFISADKKSPLAFPSLTICFNGARACSRIIETATARLSPRRCPYLQIATQFTCITLMLGIWSSQHNNIAIDLSREIKSVENCVALFEAWGEYWHAAGRLRDVLMSVLSKGGWPPDHPSATRKKRSSLEMDERSVRDTSLSPITQVSNLGMSPGGPSQVFGYAVNQPPQHQFLGAMQNKPGDFVQPYFPAVDGSELNNMLSDNSSQSTPGQSPDTIDNSVASFPAFVFGSDVAAPFQGVFGSIGTDAAVAPNKMDAAPSGQLQQEMDSFMQSFGSTGGNASLDLWSNVPTSYGLDDWYTYVTGMNTQPQAPVDPLQSGPHQPI